MTRAGRDVAVPATVERGSATGRRPWREDGGLDVQQDLDGILSRHPTVGLAVGVVRDGSFEFLRGHGVADLSSATPITDETVFRVGSITKTLTAVAVMQLWERGLVDLDRPVGEYLRAYRLIPTDRGWRPATVRHLLTHTAGIPDVVRMRDLLHPSWGPFDARPPVLSVGPGEPMPSLAEYYRGRVRLVDEPGAAFAYSGHGFAALGQMVEDMSGMPLEAYFREHIIQPLGMADTDLLRSERVRARLATGHVLGPSGAFPVADRDWLGRGGGGLFSSARGMGQYMAALLGSGANQYGSMLQPATLATMFESHYRTDPRLVGMGLGFFRHDAGGHRLIGHDGILPGFNSSLLIAPDDGVGIVALTNGSPGAMVWLPEEMARLLRRLLDVPEDGVRTDVPQHPEIWEELCGRYRLPTVGDLRGRVAMGGGLQVLVRRGRLMVRLLSPVPALNRGFVLHPDDEADPYVFRVDLSGLGMAPVRLVFERRAGHGSRAIHTDLGGQPISFLERPAPRRGGRITARVAVLAGAIALTGVRRSGRPPGEQKR